MEVRDTLKYYKLLVYYRMWKTRILKYGKFNKTSKIRILDVGCGEGIFLKCIGKWFPNSEIYGIDLDDKKLKIASERLRQATIINQDAHKLPFPDDYFDVISALQVLEHLEKPTDFILECNRVIKNEGLLIIATPNPTGFCAKVLKERWSGFNPDHISLKRPEEWEAVIRQSGFQILENGTTGLTGFKLLRIFPLSLINWIPMAIWGYFPWYKGESFMAIAKKI